MSIRALQMERHGEPQDVIELKEIELPGLQPNEVRIRMKAAPVNPADINLIQGTYPVPVTFPFTLGNEGAGEIVAIGDDVSHLKVGQRAITFGRVGAWCDERVVDGERVVAVPDDLSYEQAAMLAVNPPTAWRMLFDFVELKEGDWVVQNAANSIVGRSVIHFAKHLGLRTVNIVRREELIQPLKDEGADVVLLDEERFSKAIKQAVSGGDVKLALNAVGGKSATELAKALSRHGTHVTYGAMGLQPVEVPNGLLIFNDIRIRGFWVSEWYKVAIYEDVVDMFKQIVAIMKERNFTFPVEKTYPLEQAKDAIEHARQGGRDGKVLFVM